MIQGQAIFKCVSSMAQRIKPGEMYRFGNVVTQAPLFQVLELRKRGVNGSTRSDQVECLIFTDRQWIWEDDDNIAVHKVPNALVHERIPNW